MSVLDQLQQFNFRLGAAYIFFICHVYHWQPQPVQDLQHGRVSAAEFVQAVHEMLSSAGISLDVEKQTLLQTSLTLQEQLKESQAALLLEQVFISSIISATWHA